MSARPARALRPSAVRLALASVTVCADPQRSDAGATPAAVYTHAYCPRCRSRVMAIPGLALVEVWLVTAERERSGRGRIVRCHSRHCGALCEVIEHEGSARPGPRLDGGYRAATSGGAGE